MPQEGAGVEAPVDMAGAAQPVANQISTGLGGYQPGLAKLQIQLAGGNAIQAEMAEQKAKQKAAQLEQRREGEERADIRAKSTEERAYARKTYGEAHKQSVIRNKTSEANRQLITSNKQALRFLESGDIDVGAKRALKEKLGIETFTANTLTQALAKSLKKNPLRILSSMSGNSARSKAVFKAIEEANPRMIGTKAGIKALLQLNNSEAKAQNLINTSLNDAEQKYIDAGKPIPINLRETVLKKIRPKLDKYASVAESIIIEDYAKSHPEIDPSKFKKGEVIDMHKFHTSYKIGTKKGKNIWIPMKYGTS